MVYQAGSGKRQHGMKRLSECALYLECCWISSNESRMLLGQMGMCNVSVGVRVCETYT